MELTSHERAVLEDVASQIRWRDPAFARALSCPGRRRLRYGVGRFALLVVAVLVGPLLSTGLLVAGLDEGVAVMAVAGAILLPAALPMSLVLGSLVLCRGPRP